MGMMIDSKDLSEIVARVVKRQLSEAVVNAVEVKSDVDSDGDDVLRITIVMETSGATPDQNKMVGLVRHIRSELAERHLESFPLVSFLAKRDVAKLKLEPI